MCYPCVFSHEVSLLNSVFLFHNKTSQLSVDCAFTHMGFNSVLELRVFLLFFLF